MLECSGNARHIVGDLLAFSRPTQRSADVHDPVVPLDDGLRLARQTTPTSLTLVTQIEGHPRPIMIDHTQFVQILLTLVTTEPLLAGIVAATMEQLWSKYPRIALRAVQADAATLMNRDLPERKIELAVVPVMQQPLRSDLDVTILYRDTWHVVAGVKSAWLVARKSVLRSRRMRSGARALAGGAKNGSAVHDPG